MPADSNPTVRRRRLGAELRRLRETAGLTLEAAAAHLECHKATISRLELGRSGVRVRDLRQLLALYGIADEERVQSYIALSRVARQTGWWQQYQDTLPPTYADFIALEAESSYIRTFQPLLIPGLMQTPEYARAVTLANPSILDNAGLGDFLKVRTARQSLLTHEGGARFWGILGETALQTPIGGPEVMRAQLHQLMELMELPNVTLQVLPFAAGEHAGLNGPFVIMSFPLPSESQTVYLENLTSSLYLERPEEITGYTLAFDSLRASALNPRDSRAAIGDAVNRL